MGQNGNVTGERPAERASKEIMEGLQHPAPEQHNRVNGYRLPSSPEDAADKWPTPQGESQGSDSSRGASASEHVDLDQPKCPESDVEVKEELEDVSSQQGKRERRESADEENNHSSAASSYTGETHFPLPTPPLKLLLRFY